MITPPRLLLVGVGDLGFRVLGNVLQRGFPVHVGVAGRNVAALRKLVRLQQFTALQRDRWVDVDVLELDASDVDRTAETLAAWRPDVVFNAMSLQSWRIITELPKAIFDDLDTAQFGPWLPMHATPMSWLMQAVQRSGLRDVLTVNASFPDATNPLLATVGLAPTTGIGNVANIIPALRCATAQLCGADDPSATEVRFWAQHFLSHGIPRTGTSGGAPFVLRATHRGEDVTDRVDPEAAFRLVATTFQRQGGRQGQELTAGSAMTVLEGLLTNTRRVVHAAGPAGLPGGWPVRVTSRGVEPLDAPGRTRAELVEINEGGQRRDGIERIDADGTVWFAEENMAVMHRLLGWNVRRLRFDELPEAARELGRTYRAFAAKHGVAT